MAKAWMTDIRKTKTLKIYASADFRSSSAWGAKFFSDTIDEFNRIISEKKIAFKYEETEKEPPHDGIDGTSVQVGVSGGVHTYFQFGKNEGKLPPGSTLNGKTHIDSYSRGSIRDALIAKASIFVHSAPTITEEARPAGSGVKRYVLMHEMLHAMGLEDDDPGHKSGGKADIFRTFVGVEAGDEAEPADGRPGDRIKLDAKLYMPKFFLSDQTAKLIQSIWK